MSFQWTGTGIVIKLRYRSLTDDGTNGTSSANKPEDLATRLDNGRQSLKNTLKWLITGFGAIGAALAIGSQVSNLGKAEGLHLALGVLGAALAFAGIFAALLIAVKVLTGGDLTLGELADASRAAKAGGKSSDLVTFFERDNRQALLPYKSIDELRTKYEEAISSEDWDKVKQMGGWVDQVTNIASYEKLRRQFRKGVNWIIGSLIVTAFGILVFATGAGTSGEVATPGTPVVADEPVPVSVSLTPAGEKMLADDLGPHCGDGDIAAIAVAKNGDTIVVVTLPTAACQIVRIEVTSEIGTVTPAAPVCEIRRTTPPPRGPPNPGVRCA